MKKTIDIMFLQWPGAFDAIYKMQRCNIAVFATVCLAVFPASHGHGHSLSGEVLFRL